MANSSVRPSPRAVPAHAGAAHAARRVTPWPTAPTVTPTRRRAQPPHALARPPTVLWMGTQSGKRPGCSVHGGRRGFVPQDPQD